MSIEAEDIASWIGSEAVDQNGDKVGKVSDVFFRAEAAVIVEVTSGLVGRKRHLASLTGATVAPDFLRLGPVALVSSHGGGIDAEALSALKEADPTLAGGTPDEFESLTAREEREAAIAAAQARAEALEAEAAHCREDEQAAAERADQANQAAAGARQARIDAETAAAQARDEVDGLR